MTRSLLLLLLPLAIAGCASGPTPPVHVDVPEIARSESGTVRDARPPIEAKKEVMSFMITSDAYGIIREGDINTDPSVLRLIQHRVFERLGAGAHATVHHLVLYRNMQPQLKAGAMFAILGPIGAAIATAHFNGTVATSATLVNRGEFDAMTGDSEWKRALYAPAENPKRVSVIVSYLDLDVDGKQAFVRVVSPLQVDDGKNPFVLSLQATIDEAVKQLPDGATAPAAVAAPTAPTIPAATVPVPAAAPPIAGAPANALHLDRAMVDGKTLSYPHPRNPTAYGQVHLAFAGDTVTASNAKSAASGHYTINNDQLCMTFESTVWTPYCVYLVPDQAADDSALRVMFPRDGQTRSATLR